MNADDPRMANVECAIARIGYQHGKTGIEIAEGWIVPYIDALIAVRDGRADNPQAFPGYGEGTSEEAARRIVARLLDAGWRPPDADCLDLPPMLGEAS
ncbi:hypothetical protein OG244_28250 [Streptomyces brevispora]|uniref:hypothetical protein n=1 Tax=Streptomyces brevispora TaxID=887462 RepID=UPI002E336B3A|nr:hypothetical protein [Streptomyces brevispora]